MLRTSSLIQRYTCAHAQAHVNLHSSKDMREGKNEDSRVCADVRSTHPATPLLPNDNLATLSRMMIAMDILIVLIQFAFATIKIY